MTGARSSFDGVDGLRLRAPVFVAPGVPLRGAAATMRAEGVGSLLVGDPGEVLGIITDRDLVAALAAGADPHVVPARAAMHEVVVSARPGDRLFEVAFQMLDGEIRHIPVADEWGRVRSMVSMRDLMRPLLLDALGPEGAHARAGASGD